jgi:hypothetical protein
MTPIKTAATNLTLFAPKNWDEERDGPCAALPIVVGAGDPAGVDLFSWWQPTWSDRLAILFGRPIRLCVHAASTAHPPVMLDTEKPVQPW